MLSRTERDLSDEKIQKVAPYYLFFCFEHKYNPSYFLSRSAGVFQRNPHELQETIHFGNGSKLGYLRSHFFLFKAFSAWWVQRGLERTNCKDYDPTLSDYLFGRCQSIASPRDHRFYRVFSEDGGRKIIYDDVYSVENATQQLLLHINNVFSVSDMVFPQYAWKEITENEIIRSYNTSQERYREHRRIISILNNMFKNGGLNERDRTLYKELAFLSPEGIGNLLHSLEWHKSIAAWLDRILQSDAQFDLYLKRDDEVFFGGTDVSIQEWNELNQKIVQSVELAENADILQLHAEDFRVELAELELTAQHVAYEYICEEMRKAIIPLYKRVLWG